MSKAQYWTLNLVGGACALIILMGLAMNSHNEASSQTLSSTQAQLSRVQQTTTTMQNLVVRVAQAAQNEPALNDLLSRHNLKVNLNSDGQVKQVP